MSTLNNHQIEQHIDQAVSVLPQANPETLWETPYTEASGNEWYLDGTAEKKKVSARPYVIGALSLAACFAILFMMYFQANMATRATIYLDVDPSIELDVNAKNQVIRAQANNADGKIILENMNLKHADLNVAVNALIGSMVKHGYLSEAANMVLLSVEGSDSAYVEDLRISLAKEIETSVKELVGHGTVFDQRIEDDDHLEDLSERYRISLGKAALIRSITEKNPDLSFEDLSKMNIRQLSAYLQTNGLKIEDYTHLSGDPIFSEEDLRDYYEDLAEGDDPADALLDLLEDFGEIDDLDDLDDHDDDDHDDDDKDDDDRRETTTKAQEKTTRRHHDDDDDDDDDRYDYDDWDDDDDDDDDDD